MSDMRSKTETVITADGAWHCLCQWKQNQKKFNFQCIFAYEAVSFAD